MKLIIPTGFMPTMAHGTIIVSMCTGMGPKTVTIMIPRSAERSDADEGSKDHDRAQMPCSFFGLGAVSLTPVDLLILAIAIAFVMAIRVVALEPLSTLRAVYLRPPLRGPPLIS